MLISASIYASEGEIVKNAIVLEQFGVDFLHIDSKNDFSVFEDIKTIKTATKLSIDLHVISKSPTAFFEQIELLQIEQVAFQWEDIENKDLFLNLLTRLKAKKGIALTTLTPLPSKNILASFDFVLLMCTTPGESGGVFDKSNLARIIQLKFEFPSLKIHVDGGVNNELAFVLRLLGVDLIVSGSYLMNHELLALGMLSLLRAPESIASSNQFTAQELMIPKQYLPVLKHNEIDFGIVLQTIESYKLGFVLIENGKFEGVVTNADIRRGLIQKIDALNDIAATDLINTNPISINENASLNDLLKLIRHLNFIILFLPVVDDNKHLKGAILLNNLLRG